ncbi:MAG: 3-isopropylmalate dehydratase large subunit [Deltaproteobacteria bacterium]|nr:3-isopropylmalate dehydratase large subunit [Deltaproteobacteria bacterium]
MGLTLAEKILSAKAGKEVLPGEIVHVSPDRVMCNDFALQVIRQLRELGEEKPWDPGRIVVVIDHRGPANDAVLAGYHDEIRRYTATHGITFYDVAQGVSHPLMVENGHVRPGDVVIGTDSHSVSYGCLGAFGTGVGNTEMAAIFVTGRIWLKVPQSVKVVLTGRLPVGVYAKDIMLTLIGRLTMDGCTYRAVEYHGDLVGRLQVSERFTLCNLSVELGGKAGMVPPDEITEAYVRGRVREPYTPLRPDPDAVYAQEVRVDAGSLEPLAACPHKVDNVRPVREIRDVRVQQAFVGSCTNGSLDDLRIAAAVVRGKRVAPGVRFIIGPGSRDVFLRALEQGYIQTLVEAGATVSTPGCGACIGQRGALADGEVTIASSSRNSPGRMGSRKAEIYLASPATVAASAVTGVITDPRDVVGGEDPR